MAARRGKFADVVRGAVARRGAALMGICNVTPDSFSDGGQYLDHDRARAHVDDLLRAGADIIDVGAESTRPGSKPVPVKEQLARALPIVRYAAHEKNACVSIDTTSAEVAAACLDAGAHAVNDVSLLRDEDLARVVAGSGATLVLSHARVPQEMMTTTRGFPPYTNDVVIEVAREWEAAAKRCGELGLPREGLVMDPGLGFSKAARHSLELLRRASLLVKLIAEKGEAVPVLFGASRKSFLTLIDKDATPQEREGASLAAALHAVRSGVTILRVHDVRATRQALDLEIVLGTPRRKI